MPKQNPIILIGLGYQNDRVCGVFVNLQGLEDLVGLILLYGEFIPTRFLKPCRNHRGAEVKNYRDVSFVDMEEMFNIGFPRASPGANRCDPFRVGRCGEMSLTVICMCRHSFGTGLYDFRL